MRDGLRDFVEAICACSRIVGFTGAGVSTESGIADYRSQGGIWENFTPVYYDEFLQQPEKRRLYWQRKKILWDSLSKAVPGPAHQFFQLLHEQRRLLGLITQNIDGLHEKSGLPPERLVTLHGTSLEIICLGCGAVNQAAPLMAILDPDQPPVCGDCSGLLKPNTISFGQQLQSEDLLRAEELAKSCDLLIAAGSTLQVQPAASFPLIAKDAGALLAIITLSGTPLDRYADFVFHERLGTFLARLEADGLKQRLSGAES